MAAQQSEKGFGDMCSVMRPVNRHIYSAMVLGALGAIAAVIMLLMLSPVVTVLLEGAGNSLAALAGQSL